MDVSEAELQATAYVKSDTYDIVQELYMDYLSELKEKLMQFVVVTDLPRGSQDTDKPKKGRGKLPEISLPIFSGKYDEWVSFRDLFLSLIHKDLTLDDVEKLHYLKTHLAGEAAQLVRQIQITSANYNVAWSKLESRFNIKKYLANAILKRFMSQRNLQQESAGGIKEILDTTDECLQALKNLDIDVSTWDILVIYIVTLKLDNETRKLWEAKICKSNEFPSLSQFNDFLEERFRSLEPLDSKSVKLPNNNRNLNVKSHHVTGIESNSCPHCFEGHKLCNCKKFAKEESEARREFVQSNSLCFNCLGPNHSVFNCRQSTRCRVCKKKHHSLLHTNNRVQKTVNNASQAEHHQNENKVVATGATTSTQQESSEVHAYFSNLNSQVLLATALLKAESRSGTWFTFRSLLDQGSQASFITESAVQLLGLRKIPDKSYISGLAGGRSSSLVSNSSVRLELRSLHNPTFVVQVKAHVLSKITSFLPERYFDCEWLTEISHIVLADPKFNHPGQIDLLLGAEVYAQVLDVGLIKGPSGSLVAQNTKFGWILSGQIGTMDAKFCHTHTIVSMHVGVNDNELLKKFWELESDPSPLSAKKLLTQEEQSCEELFATTTKRDASGRYIVKLPFRTDDPDCQYGESLKIATRRFYMSEKRLLKNPELMTQYHDVIKEYVDLGHMEHVPQKELSNEKAVYLPQVIVVRQDKSTTKVRVCFDASCSGTNGVSLNNDLMIGPTLQLDLRHIIMRWRLHPICLVADIVKMYRQIKISDENVDFQRLLWRPTPESEIQHLRLLRVTFGTSVLQKIAQDEGHDFPLVVEKVLKDFYMDDLMTGCQTVEEGAQIYHEVKEMLGRGGFELQKWSSNSEDLLVTINEGRKDEAENLELKIDEVMKILGLTWNRKTDTFEYSLQLPPLSIPVTKRKVLSDISRLFDPLGWLAPTVIVAKTFIQKIWIAGTEWDKELPAELLKEWLTFRQGLSQLQKFRIPRWMNCRQDDVCRELQGFSDASVNAYSAVVYFRTIDSAGNVHCTMVASKTKVSPIKQVSVARLELCGALLLAKLLLEVSEILDIPKTHIHAWTDSTIVLCWLSSHPKRWKTFVANRVSEILTITDTQQWSHVRSKDNPADCASRGITPLDLLESQLWREGPSWLKEKTVVYGRPDIEDTKLEEKTLKASCLNISLTDEMWTRFSSLRKLVRVLALCKRFIRVSHRKEKFPLWLTTAELNAVMSVCIKQCQSQYFSAELESLMKTVVVHKKSTLSSLSPFIDQDGIMRVGGRISHAQVNENVKHPILIPRNSHLASLLIAEAHEKTFHGGPQLMVNYLRSKYWITDVKRLAKFFCRKCVRCVRHAARATTQLIGQLPAARTTPCRPFYHSGVDYGGPISIRTSKGRGHQSIKGYICLFVCMATKAVHLEAVSDMTAEGFLSAFKRFVARRGLCADLWSDNGTNFVGAAKELKTISQ